MSLDRPIFTSAAVQVGMFRSTPDEDDFDDSGPTTTFCFVFPRTAVMIEHEGSPPFLADPTLATLYNRRQSYRRRAVSRDGDRCDWFSVSEDILRDAIRAHDAAASQDPTRPIRFAHAPADAVLYRAQRETVIAAERASLDDELAIEESVLRLLDRVLASAYRSKASRKSTNRAGSEVALAAQRLIARHFDEPLTVTDIAQAVGCSRYHLCRAFRQTLGTTLHAYRNQLRLRVALERLQDASDLTQLALDLGYSSHSHFTDRFRRQFAALPSAFRHRLRAIS